MNAEEMFDYVREEVEELDPNVQLTFHKHESELFITNRVAYRAELKIVVQQEFDADLPMTEPPAAIAALLIHNLSVFAVRNFK